jgi:hypothetical protein
MWKTQWGWSHWETHDKPPTSKTIYVDIKEGFSCWRVGLISSLSEELDYLHLKDFLRYECELYLKPSLTPPQCKSIAAYHTSNHKLAIEIRRWTSILIPRVTRLCHFCSYNAVENEAHFMLACPLYNPIRYKFQSLFEHVVPGSLKSFFQLDQQVNISLLSHGGYRTPQL